MNIKKLIFKLNYLMNEYGEDAEVLTFSGELGVYDIQGNEGEKINIEEY